MTKAMLLRRHGGPDAFTWEDIVVPPPGPGMARLRHTAVAINWADTKYRQGGDSHYPVPNLPAIVGIEAAGVVEAVGAGVTECEVGDRVAYGAPPLGAYCEARNMAAKDVFVLPATVSDEIAAAAYLKGLTAQYLVERAYALKAGEVALIHAASGGVGLILAQIAKHLGAHVIGTAGGLDKVAFARALGIEHVIDYANEDFVPRVKAITGGRGVDVVYDAVGQATFMRSLDVIKTRGTMVSYGHASGKVPPLDIVDLAHKGSLHLTRATGRHYNVGRENFVPYATRLFDLIAAGAIQIPIRQRYALKDAAQAHRDLDARKMIGLSILVP
jgi:NADPH2:quinone reductase